MTRCGSCARSTAMTSSMGNGWRAGEYQRRHFSSRLSEFRRQRPELVLLQPCPLALVKEEGIPHFVARLHDAVRELCAFHSNDIVDGERLEGGRVPAAPLLEQALGYGDAEHACTDLDRSHSLILSALRGV